MKKYVYSEAKQVVVCGDFARAGRSFVHENKNLSASREEWKRVYIPEA